MAAPDPILTQIAAQFGSFTVEKSRGGYTLSDRRSRTAIARLRHGNESRLTGLLQDK
jgi:VCBS repeat-containing protein